MPDTKNETEAQSKPQDADGNKNMEQIKDEKSNPDKNQLRNEQIQNNRDGHQGRGRYEPGQGRRGRFDGGSGRGSRRHFDGKTPGGRPNDRQGQGPEGRDKGHIHENQNQRGGFRGGLRGGRGGGGRGGGGRGDGGERREKIVHPPPQFTEDGERMFTGRCRLFVGNLPQDMTQAEFEDMFKPYGKFQEAYISAGRGFGFIRMVSKYSWREKLC